LDQSLERQFEFALLLIGAMFRTMGMIALGAAGLLATQLILLRKNAPRLPRAPGPLRGFVSSSSYGSGSEASSTLEILVFGDSVACGVGCPSNDEALAGALARGVHKSHKCDVKWTVLGKSGYTAQQMTEYLVPQIDIKVKYDIVFVSVGVNAVLSLHSPSNYHDQLTSLIQNLRQTVGNQCAIVVLGMPPMEKFSSVSSLFPLSWLIGSYASNIGQSSKDACQSTNEAVCADFVFTDDVIQNTEKYMCADGFHPNSLGCEISISLIVQASIIEMQKRNLIAGVSHSKRQYQ
jgi:lysophospholipase L1-like esterase